LSTEHIRKSANLTLDILHNEGPSEEFPGEAADVIINVMNLLDNEGLTIENEVDRKMEINRVRGK
jgi:hypothetical protein